ncbi:chromatin associated protein KTI12 [Tilletiaria anomala UBC 951]|uniref:Chromatin associated protein KTI12 n=1 Tax=Tilletiaria anomala (strain ATCC 24038 / CBS 436.72 / UBC 951) TaxID=1037660 RepID=A0A066VXS0_TILAU|nr:chromatin associated protein KTI12 [Tilletiaria anomala UBC 951]KDN45088.1 chromatin associated protein KTI12 [Tilletiaria anomala UBC 951]
MALIIVSGLPSSGRSSRTVELVADFERRIASTSSAPSLPVSRIEVVSDATVHNQKSCYSNQRLEKPARASYLSAVTRALGKDCITIADGGAGLNIKGFRYQLWCAAREEGVRCVSVQVHAPPETCKEWNKRRRNREEEAYDDDTIDEMLLRYEEPNEMVRWDQPLFIVPSVAFTSDGIPAKSEAQKEPLPLDEIWDAATSGAAKKKPGVVLAQRSTAGSYLTILEHASQAVVSAMLSHQQSFGLPESGGQVRLSVHLVSAGKEVPLTVNLPATSKPVNLPTLQRLRRTFVRAHGTGNASVNVLGDAARAEVNSEEAGELEIAKRFASWLCESL